MTKKRPTLADAVDRAIAAENAAVVRTLCPKCAGTGTLYMRTGPKQWSQAYTCGRCKGTGLR